MSPVHPSLLWWPAVLGRPGAPPGSLPAATVLYPPLPPPSLLLPSWLGLEVPPLRPGGPSQRSFTSAGASGGGHPPGWLGVCPLPFYRGGPPGRFPSRVGGGRKVALQLPLTPGSPPPLLHGSLLLLFFLQLPYCSLQALPALLVCIQQVGLLLGLLHLLGSP